MKHRAYPRSMEFDRDIDAVGLLCPLPVLRAAKALRGMAPGEVLRIEASDPVAVVDIPNFCRESGHVFLRSEETTQGARYFIRRT